MKKIIVFVISIFFGITVFGQEYETGKIYIHLKNESLKPYNDQGINKLTQNENLQTIFEKHGVIKYFQAFPFAKNPELRDIYLVYFNSDDESFISDLKTISDDPFFRIERIPKPIPLYNPNDYMWYLTLLEPGGWLWHLKKIEADKAWDITKGSPNVKIAVIDTWFDINHPDLTEKIQPHYDPFDNKQFYSRPSNVHYNHGTTVASFAAGHTDGGGQLASVGFNCEIIPYEWSNGLAKALHASDVLNVDIISISWYYDCVPNSTDALIIKEILDNGTIIVAAAGNGPNYCGGQDLYPFSPNYDERIILVSSTDINDNHTYIDQDGDDGTHSHYSAIDVCAPGYNTMGASSTLNSDGSVNEWPYYGFCSGTSFATPIVAGVCGLIKSINPCLTPAEIQYIIKSTTDPIADAAQYSGLVGTGRINAYQAVLLASDYYKDFSIENGENITWNDLKRIKTLTIKNGGILTIENTTNYFTTESKIIVERGGKLVFDNARLSTCEVDKWQGIIVQGNHLLSQSNANEHGIVETKNGAIIENAVIGIGNDEELGYNYWGGIVKCENTSFINCETAVKFRPYKFENQSFFDHCTFKDGHDGVWLEGVSGIEFTHSTFENLTKGIWATDSKFEVLYNNKFNSIEEDAIYCYATAPGIASARIKYQNEFYNCQGAILLGGNTSSIYHQVYQNYFANCRYGVVFGGDNIYEVKDNRFLLNDFGVISHATNDNVNEAKCNEFIRAGVGNILWMYNNQQSTFLGNNFLETGSGQDQFDVRGYKADIDDNIGDRNYPAMNYFSSSNDIVWDYDNAPFDYWLPTPILTYTDPQNPGIYGKRNAGNSNNQDCGDAPVPVVTDVQINNYKYYYCYYLDLYRRNPNNAYYRKLFMDMRKLFHLNYYYWSILKEKNLSWYDIEQLLKTMCGDKWKIRLYGLYMEHRQYANADAILNELADPRLIEPPVVPEDLSNESRNSFITSQRLNLKYQASNGTYRFTPAELNILRTEAIKTIPESTYAHGLYTLITGQRIPLEIPLGSGAIQYRESEIETEQWIVSPNPAHDQLLISYSGKDEIEGTYTLTDLTGRIVLEGNIDYNGKSETLLDVSSMANGLYIINIHANDVFEIKKLMIIK